MLATVMERTRATLEAENARAGLRPLDGKLVDALKDEHRDQAIALRDAARVVGAAGLPSEYRREAFRLVAEVELRRPAA